MEDTNNERTPLLRDSTSSPINRARNETSTYSSLSDSPETRRKKPDYVSRQLSTIDCAAHPEDCPLVTGIGLLALDGGWGWVVVLATMLCNFLLASMSRTFGVVYPTIQTRFASTAAATTAIQSISSSLRLFGAPISSSLCDSYGARPLVIVGGCLQALGYGISAVAPNIYFLYFSLGVLTGIGGALTYTPTHILVNTYFNRKRGRALGFATSGVGIGTFLMAPLQTFLLLEYSYVGYCLMMAGILLNYIVGGALLRPIESNHAAHKVERAKILRQRSLAQRRLHASTCSNPSVFYEHEFAFCPTADWTSKITGADDYDDMPFEDDDQPKMVENFTADMASGSVTSNMAAGSVTSNMGAGCVTSNMGAGSASSNIAPICGGDSITENEFNPHESDTLYDVVVSIISTDDKSHTNMNTDSDVNTTETSDAVFDTDNNIGTEEIPNACLEGYTNRTFEDSKPDMAPEAISNMAARKGVSKMAARSSARDSLMVPKPKPHTRSVTIYDSVTEISASTRSSESENRERTFLESVTSSMRRRQESFTASVQEVSKELAFFRKKFKLFTILAFVLYSGQNLVLQFCTAVPLTFLPQLGVENGYTETAASLLISVSGVFDIAGRYLFGFLFDVRAVVPRRRLLHGMLGLMLGVATFVLGLTTDYGTMFAAAAFHGTMAGGYHAQKTSVISEFVPITLMSDAVGFSFFFEGFGSLVAAPLFGMVVDRFQTYRYGYYGCGAIFCFFTLLVLLEYCLSGVRKRR